MHITGLGPNHTLYTCACINIGPGGVIEKCLNPVIGYPNATGYCSYECYINTRLHPDPEMKKTLIPIWTIIDRHRAFMASDQRRQVQSKGFPVESMSDYVRLWVRKTEEIPDTIDPFSSSSTSYIENLCLKEQLLEEPDAGNPNSDTGIRLAKVKEEIEWALIQSKSSLARTLMMKKRKLLRPR